MAYDLDLVPVEALLKALAERCTAFLCVMALRDEDGLVPEYSFTMRGAPHEIVGLSGLLHSAVNEEVYDVTHPELIEDESEGN